MSRPGNIKGLLICAILSLAGFRAETAHGLEVISVDVTFRANQSRPYMIVNLETNPMLDVGDYAASAQTMDFSKMGQMQAEMQAMMSQMSPDEMFSKYPSISLHIPLLSYGSTGSWANIEIQTDQGKSYNPDFFEQSSSEKYLGNVTIKEFNKFVIAGRFSADIYREGSRPGQFEKVGSHSGWFRSSLPAADDPRESAELSPAEMARMDASAVLDAMSMVRGGLTAGGQMFQPSSGLPSTSPAPPLSTALPAMPQGSPEISSEGAGCICMCEYIAILSPADACRQKCEAGGLQCAMEESDPGVDALMQELESMGMSREMTEQMYDSLKDLTPAQRAQMLEMYRAIGSGSG